MLVLHPQEKEERLSELVNMEDSQHMIEEVKTIVLMIIPDYDFAVFDKALKDVMDLFDGKYPGYRKCNTQYHDVMHTFDALLAMVRLIHGAILAGKELSRDHISLGLVSALMHDTGYIQKLDEREGTGARFTLSHIQRSIEFMENYFSGLSVSYIKMKDYSDILNCTGVRTHIHEIQFRNRETELLGKMMGTADLIGQIADHHYLEKLPLLYHEFEEGKIQGYSSELDFLKKTIDFYELTQKRLSEDLDDVSKYLPLHFKARFQIGHNLYEYEMEMNIGRLKHILKHHKGDYRKILKLKKKPEKKSSPSGS